MELDARDRDKILAWKDVLNSAISLRVLCTDDKRSIYFNSFGRDLHELIPNIHIIQDKGEAGQLPAITLDRNWIYRALPTGGELGPFLELLALKVKGTSALPESPRDALHRVDWPANFKIYVTANCPFCPEVVRQVQSFPLASDNVHVEIIDGTLFPELAQADKVRSAPMVILDDQFRWAGALIVKELLDALVHRDPARMSIQELVSIIKEGNAAHLADMMLQRDLLFPAFIELLRYPNWSERLGAMVVLEQIMDERPALAQGTCPYLLQFLDTAHDPVKGDIIYLLGAVGCAGSIQRLQQLLAVEESSDNREVLMEAIEKITAGLSTDRF
jgi:glutaredoxin